MHALGYIGAALWISGAIALVFLHFYLGSTHVSLRDATKRAVYTIALIFLAVCVTGAVSFVLLAPLLDTIAPGAIDAILALVF